MEDVEVKVKVVRVDSSIDLLEKHIDEMRSAALKLSPTVVGFDFKRFTYKSLSSLGETYKSLALLLYASPAHCLIIHLTVHYEYSYSNPRPQGHIILMKFLQDPDICFVGASKQKRCIRLDTFGVVAEVLAAMVLKKPTLIDSNLVNNCREVGIHYDGPSTGTEQVEVDSWYPLILTTDQVKLVVTDAYVYYNIGHKLLNSL